MLNIHDPSQVSSIRDPDIRAWIELRFQQLFSDATYEANEHGYFIVVDDGDTVNQIEHVAGFSILDDPFYEVLELHEGNQSSGCYEMVIITNDEGYFISIWIPKHMGIDPDLLLMLSENVSLAVSA